MSYHAFEEIEELAKNSGWVRALARCLVSDSHLAEDVAQDAWLAALRSKAGAPRTRQGASLPKGPRRDLKAWLAGVVRNLSASLHRSHSRREARERRGARREAEPSTQEVAMKLEQQRLLAGAVLSLGEPYRSTILQRFFEGLPQREIARRNGVSIATVNSRLTRAIAKLREQLDATHGGNRAAWVAALLPLTGNSSSAAPWMLGVLVMKKKIAATVLAVAILATAVIVFREDSGSLGNGIDRPHTESKLEEHAPTVAAPEQPAIPRTVISPSALQPLSPDESMLVHVKMRETGESVIGADVFFIDHTRMQFDQDLARRLYESRFWPEWDFKRMAGLYPACKTNDEGKARVPMPYSGLGFSILAIRGEFTGTVDRQRPSGDVIEVLINRPLQLAVDVVDTRGKTLGDVPVALWYVPPHTTVKAPVARGVTRGGRAILSLLPDDREDSRGPFEVGLNFPIAKPVTETVLLHRWPTSPLTLVCPPTGKVIVEVTGPDGLPMPDGTYVHLTPAEAQRPGFFAEASKDGRAVFSRIGIGLELKAWAALRWDQEALHTTAPGPQTENEVVTIPLQLSGRLVDLAGRMVYEDRSAAREEIFYLSLRGEPEINSAAKSVLTDEDGRFSWTLSDYVERPRRGMLHIQHPEDRDNEAVVEIPGFPEQGRLDLGDVVIPRPEPLFAGVVVNPSGQPVVGARVTLTRPREDVPIEGIWYSLGPSAVTDANGRFELNGRIPQGDVWITAEAKGPWFHEPLPVYGKAHDLRLMMIPAGAVEGSLLLDEHFPAHRLSVKLWPHERGRRFNPGIYGWIPADRETSTNAFLFSGLKPGLYTLGIGVGINRESYVFVEDIQVHAGIVTRDPRIQSIDLRDRFRVIDLHVTNEEGRPVDAFAFALYESGRMDPLGSTNNPLLLTAAGEVRTIYVEADTYFPVSLGPFTGKRDLVLRRGTDVSLQWTGEPPPEEPLFINVALLPVRPADPRPGEQTPNAFRKQWGPNHGNVPVSGALHLRVREPGIYELQLKVVYFNGECIHEKEITPAPPPRIIVNSKHDPPHWINADPEVLKAALEEMREFGRQLERK